MAYNDDPLVNQRPFRPGGGAGIPAAPAVAPIRQPAAPFKGAAAIDQQQSDALAAGRAALAQRPQAQAQNIAARAPDPSPGAAAVAQRTQSRAAYLATQAAVAPQASSALPNAPRPAGSPPGILDPAQPQRPEYVTRNAPAGGASSAAQNIATPTPGVGIFKSGNSFSDQSGGAPGAKPYTPKTRLSILSDPAAINQADLAQQQVRSYLDQEGAKAAAFNQGAAQAARDQARGIAIDNARRKLDFDSVGNSGRPRQALRAYEASLKGIDEKFPDRQSPPQSIVPGPEYIAAQQAATARTETENQVSQANLRQEQRQQQLIQSIADAPTDRRRGLIDQALVGAGKDPDAGRYEGIESIAGYDSLGNPIKVRSLFDTRSGSVIQPTPAAGQQSQPNAQQPAKGSIVTYGGRTYRVGDDGLEPA